MNRLLNSFFIVGLIAGVAVAVPGAGLAAEHGGKEHGGAEHGSRAVKAEPSAAQIRQTIQRHIEGIERQKSGFTMEDPATGGKRTLKLVGVHERVGKTGDLYYSCADMRDIQSGELLDLDFDVKAGGADLEVVDARIHKVEGKARYTYDANDNRIPL